MTNQLTHQEKIQALTDKIDELIPLPKYVNAGGVDVLIHHGTREIDALDILRALGSQYAVTGDGEILQRMYGESSYACMGAGYITMSKPLHEQSEQVVSDLYKLFFSRV